MELKQTPQQSGDKTTNTREQMQQKIRRRKKTRLVTGLKAAGLMLLVIAFVAAIALALHIFVVEEYLTKERLEGLHIHTLTAQEAAADTQAKEALPAAPHVVDMDENRVIEPQAPTEPETVAPAETDYAPAQTTDETQELDLQLYSEFGILIDLDTNTVLAEKNADERIYPASMTKIMTALIACEAITDWDETYTMTQEIIDRYFVADATMAGFLAGEEVTMRDLLYGAVLPSGAEATYALADVIAGSEEAFATLMNEKAAELGLSDTHFVDASGLHDDAHYTTLRDMAIILQAAMDNDLCREVLSTARYTSSATEQNPEGVLMINKFLVRLETQDTQGAEILAAKTGYTAEAMNCCASYGTTPDGRRCICVTAKAWTSWYAIADQIALYATYCGEAET